MTDTIVTEKTCNTCHESKPLSEFYRASSNRDGYRGDCKRCVIDKVSDRRQGNRDSAAAYMRQYRRDNPDQAGRGRAQSDAYKAAESELRERHRDEFDALYASERAKRGLS